ncbi:MAG: site-specific integrase [Nanoarchaeota archaeon]|nr:site-specific integrase [Nanoarchaeota archaeon]
MGIKLQDNKLIIQNGTIIESNNKNKIIALNEDNFFSNDSMNFFGRHLVYYLTNSMHLGISNPEPCDLSKNTLAKVLSKLKLIDSFLQRPLDEYTPESLNEFMSAFQEGRIQGKSNRKIKSSTLNYYLVAFKRFFKIYKVWIIQNKPELYSPQKFEWIENIKSPKLIRKEYEDFPYLGIKEIRNFAKNLHDEEYELRLLLSINLMARKCEMSNLKYQNIEFRPDNKLWIILPNIKKHSSNKVSVQIYDFILPLLNNYLDKKDVWKDEDLIFERQDTAFAKHLKRKSELLIKKRITPKTLRKLGVCVAEQLGYSRSDVERIGGWAVNSPILTHYFKRKGVALTAAQNNEMNKTLHPDIVDEMNNLSSENKILKTEMNDMKNKIDLITAAFSAVEELKAKN